MDDGAHAFRAIEKTGTFEGERAVEVLLRVIGEDTERDGLRDTPSRVVKALLVTSSMLGTLRSSAETRSEFLRLCGV